MIPNADPGGNLQPGIHWATWDEFVTRFGANEHRRRLLAGLRLALSDLKAAGCRTVYVDGSFVTTKPIPGDFDACWDSTGVDPRRLDPALRTFDPGRATQKAKYHGELFRAQSVADSAGSPFLSFFQSDKQTGEPKGIVALDLRTWP